MNNAFNTPTIEEVQASTDPEWLASLFENCGDLEVLRHATVNPYTPKEARPKRMGPHRELGICAMIFHDWESHARVEWNHQHPKSRLSSSQPVPPDYMADFLERNGFVLQPADERNAASLKLAAERRARTRPLLIRGFIGMAFWGSAAGAVGLWNSIAGTIVTGIVYVAYLFRWHRFFKERLGGSTVSPFHGLVVFFLAVMFAGPAFILARFIAVFAFVN